MWVSLSGFTGEAAEVLQFDLYVQGFGFTNADGAQYLISGSNNGNLQGRVTDTVNKSVLLTKSYQGGTLRRQAHTFADDFVEALGRKGIARTRNRLQCRGGPEQRDLRRGFRRAQRAGGDAGQDTGGGAVLGAGQVRAVTTVPTSSGTRPFSRTTCRAARARRSPGTAAPTSARRSLPTAAKWR